LTYIGNIVTPLSLIYIGIVLSKAGLSSIKFDRDTILALVGRYLLSPIVMFAILALFGSALPSVEYKTFMVQAAVPGLAVLPILANEGNGDVEYATNVVTTSTLLFVIVIPIIVSLLG
jgi:malate permease and related proteins